MSAGAGGPAPLAQPHVPLRALPRRGLPKPASLSAMLILLLCPPARSAARRAGKYARVGTMLAKESVRKRMESETGISYTEFTYQLLQVSP